MKRKLKGGIESIIALVIIVGIVVALIIATVLPNANSIKSTSDAGNSRIDKLTTIIGGEEG